MEEWRRGSAKRRKVTFSQRVIHCTADHGDLVRYCNIDYVVFSALAGTKLPRVCITSDIGCQWSKRFWERNEEFPDHLRLDPDVTTVDIAIPGWHINGHGPPCKSNFNLSYVVGAGRTCGEEVETGWAHTNALGTSVREMGPGARHETLNDHWNAWNFHKVVGLRTSTFFNVACFSLWRTRRFVGETFTGC